MCIKYHFYKRYVDDTANGTEVLRCGTRWSEEEQRMILHPHLVEEDEAFQLPRVIIYESVKLVLFVISDTRRSGS